MDKKLFKIGWADAIENLNGWHNIDDAIKWAEDDDWIVHQIGWILNETEDYILFSSQYNGKSGGREQTFSGLFKIPKPWIKYKISIEPKKQLIDTLIQSGQHVVINMKT